jgi:hypothetical protein
MPLVGFFGAALLLSACGNFALIPVRRSDSGINVNVTAQFAAPPTAEQFAGAYGLIVSGTVTQVLAAQWTTPDGKRPSDVNSADVPDTYAIITPAIVMLDGPALVDRIGADLPSGNIVVATLGGTVGKDVITTNDPSQHFDVGDHLLIGLIDRSRSTIAGPAWSVGLIYRLTADGKANVAIPDATPVPAQSLLQAVRDAARATP